MPKDQQLERWVFGERARSCISEPAPLIARRVRSAGVRASGGEPRCDIGVQPPKGSNRQSIPQYSAKHPVTPVCFWPQTVSVLYAGVPSRHVAFPRTQGVVNADVLPQDLATPAIVVAGDPKHGYSSLGEISQPGEHAKCLARNDRFPFEPELEEIAVDDHRSGVIAEITEKRHRVVLDSRRGVADVCVSEDVAWGRERCGNVAG